MRVVHVVSYFPPDRVGGVGEVAFHLHEALIKSGHDSLVVTTGTSTDDQRVIRVGRSPEAFAWTSVRGMRLLRQCDVVHCHHGEALGLLLGNQLRRRVPVVCTIHCTCSGIGKAHQPYQIEGQGFGWDFRAMQQRFLKAPLRHALDRFALACLVDRPNFISRHGAIEMLGEEGGGEAKVIYNGLPPCNLSELDDDSVKPIELLYVGAASHRKRINMLPFVLRRVRAELPGTRLRLIGFRREDQPQLERLFADAGLLTAVDWVGSILAGDLPPYFRKSRVLLVPSAHEGLPMVILEAQQCGLPCIATNVSGHPEVITDGRNGFLVELDNPTEMADRCLQLLRDADLHRRMSEAAPVVVRGKFDLTRQVSEYESLYEEMILDREKQGVEQARAEKNAG